ncbi:MAG: hypothetical protein M3R13_04805 [Armatimonadota bacterium]|nr:hypothetical protein [Armatimonadota bacterium]
MSKQKNLELSMANRDIWDELELAGRGEHLDEEMFEFLSAYLDGECSAKERRLVEAYLSESSAATALLAELRSQAALVSDERAEPPAWLTQAILVRTVGKRKSRWPLATGLAAASVAATIALAAALPQSENRSHVNDVLALNLHEAHVFSGPAPDTNRLAPEEMSRQEPAAVKEVQVVQPHAIARPARFTQVAAPAETGAAGESKAKEIESAPAPSTPPVIEPDLTYAVIEYGSGRFQPKHPDVVDGSQSVDQGSSSADPKPAVLPDARERLRDQVRKVNEKKLEIDDKERTGS